MVVTLLAYLLLPKASSKGLVSKKQKAVFQIELANQKSKESLAAATTQIVAQTWTGSAQQIGPIALTKIGALAQAHHLKLNGFRPQRADNAGDLTLQPFLINIAGTFPDLIGFTKEIEAKGSRLAINMIQVASADSNTDAITASVGVMAYTAPQKPATTTTTTKTTVTKNG